MKVREAMMTDCIQVPRGMTIRELVDEHALWTIHRCFPVVEDGRILGAVMLDSVRQIPREQWETTKVEEVMIPFDEMKTIHPDDEIYDAMRRMAEEVVDQLFVVENGRFVGVISRKDLMDSISGQAEHDA